MEEQDAAMDVEMDRPEKFDIGTPGKHSNADELELDE